MRDRKTLNFSEIATVKILRMFDSKTQKILTWDTVRNFEENKNFQTDLPVLIIILMFTILVLF